MSGDIVESNDVSTDKEDPLEYYYRLPAVVRRRVKALKRLLHETVKIDAAFYKDLFELELKYDANHQRIFEQRKAIITGSREPTDDECDWPSDDEHPSAEGDEVDKLCDGISKTVGVSKPNEDDHSKGIPEFWLQVLKNAPLASELIQEHDEKILRHLTDIKCTLHSDKPGFSLEFFFSPNDYFTNKVLTKRYFFNYDISPDEPFDYEGPEIVSTKGCTINWNSGKNVTVKIVKKIQKQKGGGAKRTITKSVQEDSFFNFFNPPTEVLSDELDDDTQLLLESDFKLGQFMRDSVIPRAVLFFTGEELAQESDDEDDEDDEEDEDDDDSEDEEEPHVNHRGRRHKHSGSSKSPGKVGAAEQPECKQQ
ncbi:unnamed protein product [Dicrocoelium dendriticum]|nr:unnamed protein product [Dicrocoelium dendriticum]